MSTNTRAARGQRKSVEIEKLEARQLLTTDPISLSQAAQFSGQVNDVAVSGNYAYLCAGPRLKVLNVANPQAPALVADLLLPAVAKAVTISGNYAYVADDSAGLQVVNITAPASPSIAGTYSVGGYPCNSVVVSGSRAYLAQNFRFAILDVSNPAAPALLGSAQPTWRVEQLAVSGTMAYVVDSTHGVTAIDITNPASPSIGSTYAHAGGYSYSIAASGNYVYLGNTFSGFTVLNNMVKVGSTLAGPEREIVVSGTLAYVAEDYGIGIYNIATPTAPARVSGTDFTQPTSWGLALSGTRVFLAAPYLGMRIYNASTPSAITTLGTYTGGGIAWDSCIVGSTEYVANHFAGLDIFDISNPASPMLLSRYDTPDAAVGVVVSQGLAYVSDGASGLQIINVSNPSAPFKVGSYDTSGVAVDIALAGNRVYIADDYAGIQIIDVTNPAAPTRLGGYVTSSATNGIFVSGNIAYVAAGPVGIYAIDVSDPAAPAVLSLFDTAGALDVFVAGTTAYVADGNGGMKLLDYSNPSAPQQLGAFATSGTAAYSVNIVSNLAYIAAWTRFYVVDISNPAAPVQLTRFILPSGSLARRVSVVGNLVHVASENAGVVTLQATLVPPSVLNSSFSFETAHALMFNFNEDVSTEVQWEDLQLTNLTDGHDYSSSLNLLTLSNGGTTATWKNVPQLPLPDGQYLAKLPAASIRNRAGAAMSADATLTFFVRTGDANHDGAINGDDYFAIDAGYASQAAGYSHGDFDYNGHIDADDYFLIDSNYNKPAMPLAGAPVALHSAGATATGSQAERKRLDELA